MQSLKAHLLVASPQLADPNFYRSVVLIIQHDHEGALGLLLNRPTDITVAELWERIDESPCYSDRLVNLGGPVAGPLMSVHADPGCSQAEVVSGVYFATDKDLLNQLVQQEQTPFYIFSGYSGWGAGQLDQEMEMGGWLTTKASYDYVFSKPDEMWKRVSADIGRDILSPVTRRIIDDPQLN